MKVCFVGIGSIARRHIRNLLEVCNDRNIDITIDALRRKSSNELEKIEGVSNIYFSTSEMPSDYDVIFLTNPTEYHAQALIELHNYARHFFIEKPVTSLDTIDTIKQLELRDDSVYYVACPLRYTNVIQFLKENIDISKVNSVRCISSSYLPDWRPGIDYRTTYSAHKDLGGGVSIDLIHEWDYLAYLFGMPVDIKSFIGKTSKLEIDSDDYAIYIARYANGIITELHLDYFGRQPIRQIEVFTDDETIVGDLIGGSVRFLKSGKLLEFESDRDIYQKRELDYFLDVISGKADEYNNIYHGIRVLQLTQGVII